MTSYSKRDRIEAAIARVTTDLTPRVMWTHLVSEHLTPAQAAVAHLRFQQRYDWDLLKVMHDVRLSPPQRTGSNGFEEWEQWAQNLELDDFPFAYQTELISILLEQFGSQVPIVETIFGPIQSLNRAVGGSAVHELAIRSPDLLASVATSLAEVIGAYMERLADMGCYGVFYTPGGLSPGDAMGTDVNYATWFGDHDLALTARASNVGLRRILHLHGNQLIEARCARFSAEIWNWAHYDTRPRVGEWLDGKRGAVIGGVRHTAIVNRSASEVTMSINDFLVEAGESAIIGPGCAVPGSVSSLLLDTIRGHRPPIRRYTQ